MRLKKRLFGILLCGMLMLCFSACGVTYQQATNPAPEQRKTNELCGGYFTVLTTWHDVSNLYYIAYANDTKVKYLVIDGYYQFSVSPLYNTDGTVQIYE